MNYGGKWNEEEVEQLKRLVAVDGHKWKDIGQALGRTALNVRDKWKAIGADHHYQRNHKHWTVQEVY